MAKACSSLWCGGEAPGPCSALQTLPPTMLPLSFLPPSRGAPHSQRPFSRAEIRPVAWAWSQKEPTWKEAGQRDRLLQGGTPRAHGRHSCPKALFPPWEQPYSRLSKSLRFKFVS